MRPESIALLAAAGTGVLHALLGPDHSLPFIALGKSRGWSPAKAASVVGLAGAGHLLGSLLLGAAAVALGLGADRWIAWESARGAVAGWMLAAGGIVYAVWGLRRLARARWGEKAPGASLFVALFLLGPCEPLIPFVLYGARSADWTNAAWTVAVFGLATILTMEILVLSALHGLRRLSWTRWERYVELAPGAVLALCGLGMIAWKL